MWPTDMDAKLEEVRTYIKTIPNYYRERFF